MKTTATEKAERAQFVARRRDAHNKALETLHAMPEKANGLKMWRALRRLESLAHSHATAYCNGERAFLPAHKGQKLPEKMCDYRADSEESWEALKNYVHAEAAAIFGRVPSGFYVNGDARGSALKLDSEKTTVPEGMETDWGRDGILAAFIS